MGKDREGRFHPQKGKPSGSGTEENIGLNPAHTERLDDYLEISEKYNTADPATEPTVKIRHPNRNVNKGEEQDVLRKKEPQHLQGKPGLIEDVEQKHATVGVQVWEAVSKDQLTALWAVRAYPAITLYMSTHRAGVEVNEQHDLIAFKNQLQDIAQRLKQAEIPAATIQRLLEPGYDLLGVQDFWKNLSEGIGCFIAEDFFAIVKLPYQPQDELLVSTTFSISQLNDLFAPKKYFYVLVLSKKQARLFKADAFGMTHIPIEGMPEGIADFVHLEEKDDQKLFRTESSGAGEGANYHGMGGGRPDDKDNLAMYFDEVDETVADALLKQETAPLLLAGVEYLIPIFKQVSKYKHIADVSLTGSYEHAELKTIYAEAREKMERVFRQEALKALENYADKSATDLTSYDARVIIPAAEFGRVARLFLQKGQHIWGNFDAQNDAVQLHDGPTAENECLINRTIMQTWLHGGDVYFINADEMPSGRIIAALMRYNA